MLAANYAGRTLVIDTEAPWQSTLTIESGFDQALAEAKAVFPETTSIAMVSGVSEAERRSEAEIGAIVQREGFKFIDLAAGSLAELTTRVRQLPPDALLFIAGGQVDESGGAASPWQLCGNLSREANRPAIMFGAQFLGCGIVGGLMRDFGKVGRIIAARALAIATEGARLTEVVPFKTIATRTFDARELERWGVADRRLPAGSVVAFRRGSVWRDYRANVETMGAVLLVQFGLIAWLLYERRARRKAEVNSRRSLVLAAHADRRSTVAALAGSIAHELSQPLGSILHNVYAAERMLASGPVTADTLQDILRDIRNDDTRAVQIVQRHRALLQKRDMERARVDLHSVVCESLAVWPTRRFTARSASMRRSSHSRPSSSAIVSCCSRRSSTWCSTRSMRSTMHLPNDDASRCEPVRYGRRRNRR